MQSVGIEKSPLYTPVGQLVIDFLSPRAAACCRWRAPENRPRPRNNLVSIYNYLSTYTIATHDPHPQRASYRHRLQGQVTKSTDVVQLGSFETPRTGTSRRTSSARCPIEPHRNPDRPGHHPPRSPTNARSSTRSSAWHPSSSSFKSCPRRTSRSARLNGRPTRYLSVRRS